MSWLKNTLFKVVIDKKTQHFKQLLNKLYNLQWEENKTKRFSRYTLHSFSLPRVINHKLIHHHESLHSRAFSPMFFTVKLTTRRPPAHHFLHHLKHHWHQQRQLVFSLSSNNSVPFTTTQFHAAAKHNQPPTAAPSPWTTHT
jgi:hypothetical protein